MWTKELTKEQLKIALLNAELQLTPGNDRYFYNTLLVKLPPVDIVDAIYSSKRRDLENIQTLIHEIVNASDIENYKLKEELKLKTEKLERYEKVIESLMVLKEFINQ